MFKILFASFIIWAAILAVFFEGLLIIEGLLGRDRELPWEPWDSKRLSRTQLCYIFGLYFFIVFLVALFN